MSPFRPTRRDLLLVLTCFLVLGLFLQFDFSLRFDYSSSPAGVNSRYDKWGLGGNKGAGGKSGQGVAGDRYLSEVEAGARADGIRGVGDAKLRWGEEGAVRTEILAHAPGWTVFDSIYLYNGTWYIVTDNPSSVPLLRMMMSTGNEIWNDQESIQGREPTDEDLRIIFPTEAKRLWGNSASQVSGTTFLINDPPQFLDHYYHFAAEMLVGMWRTYSSLDPNITPQGHTHLPAPTRMMFPHTMAATWNDYAKMNSFISRAVFPSMSYEYMADFLDRADTERAFVFDRIVFADRAAAFRGPQFQKTWRTSSEAMTLPGSQYWWTTVRKNLLEFVSGGHTDEEFELEDSVFAADDNEDSSVVTETDIEALEEEEGRLEETIEEKQAEEQKHKQAHSGKPVITYVSRQEWGRRMLTPEAHESLVTELEKLREKYGWEVNIVAMDKLTRDDQIRLAARTTIMMGVHGNGLTHLLWMNAQNPHATVIEFFCPGGFAEDYEFTARALGIRHYGFWGDEYFTEPDLPQVNYPECFQGNEIPCDGKVVADLIVRRLLVDKVNDEKSVEAPPQS